MSFLTMTKDWGISRNKNLPDQMDQTSVYSILSYNTKP